MYLCLFIFCLFVSSVVTEKVVVGYWESNLMSVDQIPWSQITHINYGPVPVNQEDFEIENKQHLARLVGLAHQNNVKTLLSIGGWRGSKAMSRVVSTPEHRTKFTNKVVAWLIEFGLDGINIDW
jgi:chitinase